MNPFYSNSLPQDISIKIKNLRKSSPSTILETLKSLNQTQIPKAYFPLLLPTIMNILNNNNKDSYGSNSSRSIDTNTTDTITYTYTLLLTLFRSTDIHPFIQYLPSILNIHIRHPTSVSNIIYKENIKPNYSLYIYSLIYNTDVQQDILHTLKVFTHVLYILKGRYNIGGDKSCDTECVKSCDTEGLKSNAYRGVNDSIDKQQGVNNMSNAYKDVKDSIDKQQGANNMSNAYRGVNKSIDKQPPFNKNINTNPGNHPSTNNTPLSLYTYIIKTLLSNISLIDFNNPSHLKVISIILSITYIDLYDNICSITNKSIYNTKYTLLLNIYNRIDYSMLIKDIKYINSDIVCKIIEGDSIYSKEVRGVSDRSMLEGVSDKDSRKGVNIATYKQDPVNTLYTKVSNYQDIPVNTIECLSKIIKRVINKEEYLISFINRSKEYNLYDYIITYSSFSVINKTCCYSKINKILTWYYKEGVNDKSNKQQGFSNKSDTQHPLDTNTSLHHPFTHTLYNLHPLLQIHRASLLCIQLDPLLFTYENIQHNLYFSLKVFPLTYFYENLNKFTNPLLTLLLSPKPLILQKIYNSSVSLEGMVSKLDVVNGKNNILKGVNDKDNRLEGVNDTDNRLEGVNSKDNNIKGFNTKDERLEGVNDRESIIKGVNTKDKNKYSTSSNESTDILHIFTSVLYMSPIHTNSTLEWLLPTFNTSTLLNIYEIILTAYEECNKDKLHAFEGGLNDSLLEDVSYKTYRCRCSICRGSGLEGVSDTTDKQHPFNDSTDTSTPLSTNTFIPFTGIQEFSNNNIYSLITLIYNNIVITPSLDKLLITLYSRVYNNTLKVYIPKNIKYVLKVYNSSGVNTPLDTNNNTPFIPIHTLKPFISHLITYLDINSIITLLIAYIYKLKVNPSNCYEDLYFYCNEYFYRNIKRYPYSSNRYKEIEDIYNILLEYINNSSGDYRRDTLICIAITLSNILNIKSKFLESGNDKDDKIEGVKVLDSNIEGVKLLDSKLKSVKLIDSEIEGVNHSTYIQQGVNDTTYIQHPFNTSTNTNILCVDTSFIESLGNNKHFILMNFKSKNRYKYSKDKNVKVFIKMYRNKSLSNKDVSIISRNKRLLNYYVQRYMSSIKGVSDVTNLYHPVNTITDTTNKQHPVNTTTDTTNKQHPVNTITDSANKQHPIINLITDIKDKLSLITFNNKNLNINYLSNYTLSFITAKYLLTTDLMRTDTLAFPKLKYKVHVIYNDRYKIYYNSIVMASKEYSNMLINNYSIIYSQGALEGVSKEDTKVEGVKNIYNEQRGVSDSTSELKGVNTTTNTLHPVNKSTNEQQSVNTITNTLNSVNSSLDISCTDFNDEEVFELLFFPLYDCNHLNILIFLYGVDRIRNIGILMLLCKYKERMSVIRSFVEDKREILMYCYNFKEYISREVGVNMFREDRKYEICKGWNIEGGDREWGIGNNTFYITGNTSTGINTPYIRLLDYVLFRESNYGLVDVECKGVLVREEIIVNFKYVNLLLDSTNQKNKIIIGNKGVLITNMINNRVGVLKMCEILRCTYKYMCVIGMWKVSIDSMLKGVRECLICYLVMGIEDNCFPSFVCKVCKNTYHRRCIDKMVRKSGNKRCPICRMDMVL